MSALILWLIEQLVTAFAKSDEFARIEASVRRWEAKELTSAEKRTGVLGELQVIGLDVGESLANLMIELAVAKIKTAAKA